MKHLIQFLSETMIVRVLRWSLGVSMIALASGSSALGGDIPSDTLVQSAYQLRLTGKVDDAMALLIDHIAADSTNAAAHYEIARAYYYICTGDPKRMMSNIESSEKSIKKAVEIDPGNPIYRYFAARVAFLNAYIAMQSDGEHAKEHVAVICRAYEAVLEVQPDYGEAILNLVELYGGLPQELGRDSTKAAQFEERLQAIDYVLAGKGHCIMMPSDFDRITYWTDMAARHPKDLCVLEELGKTYLREGKTALGVEHLERVIKNEPSKSGLYLVIADHHIMKVWQDKQAKGTSIPLAVQAINNFLATDPIIPLKAYALGLLAKLNYTQENKAEGDRLFEQAMAADAYFSKASGIPLADLFEPPGQSLHSHSYLFQMY